MKGRLQGQVALVGGNAAVAAAVARRFEAEGARVVVCTEAEGWADAAADAPDATILIVAACHSQPDIFIGHADRATRAALPALQRNGGAVVHIALPAASAGAVTIGMVNGALRGYVRGCAIELGEHGIRVNLIQPGVVRELVRGQMVPPAPLHVAADSNNRTATLADIAAAALFLASDEAAYIHGAEHVVDGGLSQYRDASGGRRWDSSAGEPIEA